MRNKRGLNNILSSDRKTLYMLLSIVMVSVLTLTVVYAALSTTLNINGKAEVSAASWNIHLDNVQLNSQSATTTAPTITNSTSATFSTTLTKPGDFYEFTIDVVNDGSIDAMIDSVTKIPELSDTQKKYLNYVVEYQNGEAITTKQLVEKQSFVRLKVKVEFRKDISASDLPTLSETLNLSFKVNYVQSDESGTMVPSSGKESLKPTIISGDLKTVGSEVALGDEHFYIISSDEENITMLAKYNLEVGNICTSSTACTPIENPTGKQDSTMIGRPSDNGYPRYGTTVFSSTYYWSDGTALKSEYGEEYPVYIYDSNSNIYNYIENYKTYLESQGANIEEARLIKMEELEELECSRSTYSCSRAPSWVYTTTYWTGMADNNSSLWSVYSNGDIFYSSCSHELSYGVRPVIVVKS